MSEEMKMQEKEVVSPVETENSEDAVDENPRSELATGLSKGDSVDFKWYVAHTLTGQENKVARAIKERILNTKLTEFFADILVPEETVTSHVNGKKRTLKKKFFPGYVLIKMVMDGTTWDLVKNTNKVTGFLGGIKGKPTPLSKDEVEYMTGRGDAGLLGNKRVHNYVEGDSVKVIEGPFASFVGTIESVNDKGKIKVNVSIFGRPTPVELDVSQVESVS